MRIWRIEPSPSNKDEVWWKENAPYETIGIFNGKFVEETHVFSLIKERKRFKKDLHWFERGALVLSDRAFKVLGELIDPWVQSVRVSVGDGAWLVFPTVVIDCLGPLAEVDYMSEDEDRPVIRRVWSFDVLPQRVTAPIFKIRGMEIGFCFCTDELVEKAVIGGLEGFRFTLAWDSSVPFGTIKFRGFLEKGDYYLDSGKKGKACLPKGSEESYGVRLVSPPEGARAENAPCPPEDQSAASLDGIDAPVAASDAPARRKPASYDGPPLDADILAARAAALASLPDLPALGGALSDGPCAPLGSRVGGEPAMLPGEEWPLGPGGEPLCFLAQLDMADLSALPGFPRRGLLRLFVGEEPEYGLDPGDMTAQLGFRALFAPDASGALPRPAPSEEAEDGLAWGEGPWAVRFGAPAPTPPDDFDVRLQEAFSREWAGLHPGLPAESISDADRYASARSLSLDMAIAAEEAAGDPPTVQAGGWPSFVQADDRRSWEGRYERYDALLLQLSSDPGRWINIGDGGRMYFFIPSANLAAGDFSDVMYWWDGM